MGFLQTGTALRVLQVDHRPDGSRRSSAIALPVHPLACRHLAIHHIIHLAIHLAIPHTIPSHTPLTSR
ncbi:hypothetical protein EYF80_026910 [Liparis tanakae]|uniref:Uncharacterized protein n=1 Tax=Liparis tanakae TaxID=230148 RepID=A0A4Z2HC30_9TELE|nr:hypothetical protein EYF80_026910 [Liparis tanakae]